jgi:hypothetical protein
MESTFAKADRKGHRVITRVRFFFFFLLSKESCRLGHRTLSCTRSVTLFVHTRSITLWSMYWLLYTRIEQTLHPPPPCGRALRREAGEKRRHSASPCCRGARSGTIGLNLKANFETDFHCMGSRVGTRRVQALG